MKDLFGTLRYPWLAVQAVFGHVLGELLREDLREMSARRKCNKRVHTFSHHSVHHGPLQEDRVFANVLTRSNLTN